MIGAVANIILDPIFIFGFGMGVKGAAEVSTVSIAPAIAAAINEVSEGRLTSLPFDIETILNGLKK